MKKVSIIGGAGFIGSHITKKFLENGFEVKVSTTDISNKNKYQHLMDLPYSDHLYISEMNVKNISQIRDFVKDSEIIIHSGTPFQLNVEDVKSELFDPTIKGTENFLSVIEDMPSVEKVVFIASVAAWNTNFPLPASGKTANDTFNESDVPFISNESHPYCLAKYMANETVNNFVESHPNLDFEITSISPVMVIGKSLSQREDSTSGGIQFLLKNKIAPDAFFQMFYDNDVDFAVVNVKDVAESVYKAATTKGLHGKDYLISSETYRVSDITLMLNNREPKNPGKIIYENQLAKADLGIEFESVQNTLKEFSN